MINIVKHWLVQEASYDPILRPYREAADQIMFKMTLFLFVVCLALAPINNTFDALLLIGIPTVALAYWFAKHQSGALITRFYMGSAFMIFTGLIIHQLNGDIEAHFSAFGLIGVLLYYRDWRTIVVATLVIYMHHLVLGYAQTLGVPVYVFDDVNFWELFFIHVAYFLPFIGMMLYLSISLRREGYENKNVLAIAQEITQGNLVKDKEIPAELMKMPLIHSVVTMKNRLLDLLRVMPVPTLVIRLDQRQIVTVNEAWQAKIGPAWIGMELEQAIQTVEVNLWHDLLATLEQSPNKLIEKKEIHLKNQDGSVILCEVSLIMHDETHPTMVILTLDDITERRENEIKIKNLAYHDQLTGLANRARFHQFLDMAFEDYQDQQTPFAIFLIDLDGFKPINDTYGHDAGDDILRFVAKRLTQQARQGDLPARIGGDEFVVLLNNCQDKQEAQVAATRLLEAIRQPIMLRHLQIEVSVGASIGLAHIAAGAQTDEELIKQADIAMYQAKERGKNQVVCF
ncbi:sensor domain-containing diguanylate cyclase [Thiomicrospira microaerophila]|uniref:sensor domain-containing diguanylate cyclase n=1 Tax=Thiomicrospira microaerophila TaxID=406020 RepID=UPI000699238C|nr:sensor domain-containing diguanylate cyclase [Thiomicrospira microaerophila]